MTLATLLPLGRLCQLATVSRAGFYRWRSEPLATDAYLDLRDLIQPIALEFSCYGSRRVTHELRRRGQKVNRKRVQRILRQDNLLGLRKRRFVTTTDSSHGLKVYPPLARDMVLSGLNQLWVADITSIRLETEFLYLAVVLDAYSRRVIGWTLDRTLQATLAFEALRMALDQRRFALGRVHHSDRGVPYASTDYTTLLKANGVAIRMSRKGNPYDNAKSESFMKTLKYEEVYRNEYRDLEDARAQSGEFLEKVYNQNRLHSALNYLPPAEFEEQLAASLLEIAVPPLAVPPRPEAPSRFGA
jgi:transposase InsO family protein